ncbi:hypothetical protein [Pseudacidovorax sp. RU35E]|jgi:hypothetical protein|uniref:hypothetical protein n=1 Tax=Pseudacidovorax sp. RU35E TaxID=1907403 RepID=UPI000954DAE2|nr:hypothetical protein [Pseudacidovorax sp. RU35E]SIQ86336.1 hypothetical protein SAMN05880557_106111 [Pseudacidovorax sp. RU35E]
MHHAPAVSFPVGSSRRAAALHLGIASAGGLGALGWCLHFGAFDAATLVIVSAAAAGMLLALRTARSVDVGMLHWAGGEWSVTDARGLDPWSGAVLEVIIDLGTLMLARCATADGRRRWFWLDRQTDPLRWRALRRAAFDGARTLGRRTGEAST